MFHVNGNPLGSVYIVTRYAQYTMCIYIYTIYIYIPIYIHIYDTLQYNTLHIYIYIYTCTSHILWRCPKMFFFGPTSRPWSFSSSPRSFTLLRPMRCRNLGSWVKSLPGSIQRLLTINGP